jgi:hypothetical protein
MAPKKVAVLWQSAILCRSCHSESQDIGGLRFTASSGPWMAAKIVAVNGSISGSIVAQCFPTYSERTQTGRCFSSRKEITEVARGSLERPNQRRSACTSCLYCLSCFHIWR